MMRRETAEPFERPTISLMAPASVELPHARMGLLMATLTLLLAAPAALAEPAALPAVSAAPPPAALDFSIESIEEALTSTESAIAVEEIPPVDDVPTGAEAPRPNLEELLFVRGARYGSWTPRTTDEVLAAAVANGTNPDLEPRNPFRKRSRDLFRTERPVTIGNADMLLRLRLRAKARRAMSVELHF